MLRYLHIFARMYFNRLWLRHTVNLIDYVSRQGNGRPAYTNLCHHLIKYRGEDVRMCEIDRDYIFGFVEYLRTASPEYVTYKARTTGRTLSAGTQLTYYNMLRSILNAAVRDSILESNPANKLSSKQKPHRCESNRTFLTIDEVKRLSDAKVSESDRVICEAFLFCCFCGLRYSDVSRLRWSQLHILSDGRYQLALVQKKTSKRLYLPLSENAMNCIPTGKEHCKDDLIFDLPPYWDINKAIDRWARNAGLDKHVTFHVSRHTFATMELSCGVDIYTVSKLLGHSSVNTTQIYAKVVDKAKREAVDKIPLIVHLV